MSGAVTSDQDKTGFLRRWAFRAADGERGPAALLRCCLRVLFLLGHVYTHAAISLRAAALTYSIVLALVPLLAMSTAILKGLGGGDQLQVAAYRLLDQLDSAASQHPRADGTGEGTEAVTPPASGSQDASSLTRDLRRAVDTIFAYVDRTNFAAIGAFGIVGLLLTVVMVMSTVEEAMNAIWHTDQGRSLLRKVMDYLALVLLLPVSINVAIAGEAILASPTMLARIHTVLPSPWLINTLLKLLPFFFVVLSLTVMYMFFPSVRVRTAAALTGAFCGAVFWFLGQKVYLQLQIGVARANAIYGSFASIPLFLLWVQLGWTFILLGAALAYAIQHRDLHRLPGPPPSPQHQLQLAFDVLRAVYADFAQKKPTTAGRLTSALKGEQPAAVFAVAATLMRGGFLALAEGGRGAYLPTAPAEAVQPEAVVRLILGDDPLPTPGGRLARTAVAGAAVALPPDALSPAASTAAAGNDFPKETEREETL